MRLFLLALGFLTRLAPPMTASVNELRQSVRYYPLVGAVLGLLATLPLCLGLFPGQAFAGAWFYVLFSAWLTRGLHYDGLADLADALGSGKTGGDFWAVAKDSRLGAFGGLALVLAAAGGIFLVSPLLSQGRFTILIFAPVLGRSLPAILAWLAPARPGGLGAILAPADGPPPVPVIPLLILAGGSFICLPFWRALLALALCAALIWGMVRLAEREGGFNGDCLGALILLGELSFLAAALA